MRYFLHLVTDARFIRDPDGAEFSGIAEAETEAAQSARDLMCDELRRGRPIPNGWRMLIATEDDTILKTIPFLVVAHGGEDRERMATTPTASARDTSEIRAVEDHVHTQRNGDQEARNPSSSSRPRTSGNGERERSQLAKTDTLIARAHTHIEAQRVRIAILESDGRDASLASDLLRHLEKTLRCAIDRRRVIVKELGRLWPDASGDTREFSQTRG
jgi:hypothetical protein